MQNKASQPLIETLPMTLGVPYTDDPSAPLNIEIPLQVALPDGQTLYAAVALGSLPFHGQQQIVERIVAAWNAFTGVGTSNIAPPRQCLHQIQEPPTKTEALAHYSQQAILAMGEAAHAAVAVAVAVPTIDALREAEAALEVAIARILKASPGHAISVTSEAKALVAVRAALATTPAAQQKQGGEHV
ncbi:hypothetical protein [Comamonas sp. 26]|uniref:hypothetical protein n=1 Tax=Comamonas sp. 26 TaxID=2035201 RepID=UPI000C68BB7B|nr:hypothetical protein [Comamonas sp. 26]PIG09632.1 hypothetical protein CLU84_2563 [Comamonas sp. 26]